MNIKYPWRRFCTPPNSRIGLIDDGFLTPPDDPVGKYVNSHLRTLDSLNNINCLILLGEPGIGKSIELRNFYEATTKKEGNDKTLWIDLKSIMTPDEFIRELEYNKNYKRWIKNKNTLYLFLDSFDEGLFTFEHIARAFGNILGKQKDKINLLFLRISCRTAVWPKYFEDELQVLWEDKQRGKYELQPLTKQDIFLALKANNLDEDKFISEVMDKNVEGLAAKPLTLELLMDIFKQKGSLPTKKGDIYLQGCKLLIEEPDHAKKTSPSARSSLGLTQRLVIAERIAAATLIGGKSAVEVENTVQINEGEIHISELEGNETLDRSSFFVGEYQLQEVLNTGLFSSRGDGKLGWAHQTYGEFLATQYLVKRGLDWKHLQKLLFHDPFKNGSLRAVPQLYEVSAWLASLNTQFFDKAVSLDPEFLLLTDTNALTNLQKEVLVERLLIQFTNGELLDRPEIFNYKNYKKLCHPNIAKQLQPYIEDSSKGFTARSVALNIASACSTSSLEKILVKIALDQKEKIPIRARAILAIAEFGSDNARNGLKSLISSGFNDDPEDELKGVTLRALWSKYISAKELFSLINPPKRRSLFGTYHDFVGRQLGLLLDSKDLLVALDWVEKNAVSTREVNYSFKKLADEIILKAWENLNIPGVLRKFSSIVYKRLNDFEEIAGDHALDDKIVASFQKSLEKDDKQRRNLLREIILLQTRDPKQKGGRRGYILLHPRKIRLIYAKDLSWLIQWLYTEKDNEINQLLVELISGIFRIGNSYDVGLVNQARNKQSTEGC